MGFTRDNSTAMSVRRVEPGAIAIGADTFTDDVLIFRDEIRHGVAIDDIATLSEEQLDELLPEGPEIVILGTGFRSRRPPRELVFAMARRGIGFETMDTPAACRTFNILKSEGRDVAAILIVRE